MLPDLPFYWLYLIKANAALLLFAAVYYGLLRQLTFYRLNRAYLLLALLFAASFPAVDVSAWLKSEQVTTLAVPINQVWVNPIAEPLGSPTVGLSLWESVQLAYWSGLGVFGVRLLLQLAALYRLHRRSTPSEWRGQPYRRTADAINPFSFGRAVYLNPAQHRPEDMPAILLHERVHVQQWHTLDVLLAQTVAVLCWFNPAAWWLKRAVQRNLEFLTDQAVVRSGLDRRAYQFSLLHLHQLPTAPALANHFAFLTLKTRIAMMNKRASGRPQLAKYLLAGPLAAALLASFAATQAEVANSVVAPGQLGSFAVEKQSAAAALPPASQQGIEPVYYLDGVRVSKAETERVPGTSIANMSVLKGEAATQAFGEEGRNGVALIVTKKNQESQQVREFNRRHGLAAHPEASKQANQIKFRPPAVPPKTTPTSGTPKPMFRPGLWLQSC